MRSNISRTNSRFKFPPEVTAVPPLSSRAVRKSPCIVKKYCSFQFLQLYLTVQRHRPPGQVPPGHEQLAHKVFKVFVPYRIHMDNLAVFFQSAQPEKELFLPVIFLATMVHRICKYPPVQQHMLMKPVASNRRAIILVTILCSLGFGSLAQTAAPRNLALAAKPSTSFVSGHETLPAINDGFDPRNSDDKTHGAYGNWPRSGLQWVQYRNWPRSGPQWVQYDWPKAISTKSMDVYWFDDHRGVRLPSACRVKYWDGNEFVDVKNASGLGLAEHKFNPTTFDEVTTTKLRLEFDSVGKSSTGILEWRVYDSGKSPNFAPVVVAGEDRVALLGTQTHLAASARDDGIGKGPLKTTWTKESGRGRVTFQDPKSPATTAEFSRAGDYVLKLTVDDGELKTSGTLKVKVDPQPPTTRLDPVYTTKYKLNSPLWNARAKKLIVNWIPHCYTKIADTNLAEGGIVNFIQAGNKNAGRPYARHKGPVFANAWVHNTVEAMCIALMVDPQGDQELIAAQNAIRAKLDEWIPIILSAQEPDGYLQTCYTLNGHKRWSNKADHEGYLAGYFMESAIAHYLLTDGKDRRMYDAAKKLADCWVANIGPSPKRAWYEGHQELEQALVSLARFVEHVEGPGKGRQYVELAKFLLDSRKDGDEYDQSHLPVTQQYEAVGHSVRAVYSYSGMTDIAMETGDRHYHSAVKSIWNNMVNKKYYVTGGVGSGETSEGFGKNYSLPNGSYCESCAGCGELFFQYKMNMAYHESKYADLYEETIYNAILGSVDLEGQNFTYTNPLDAGGARYKWHGCPCCVGNIPRTLLMLPSWMYLKSKDSLYVNLFAGSTVNVGKVGQTEVQVVQTTDYPWKENVSLTVNPATPAKFSLKIRQPNRTVSELYQSTPKVSGISKLSVNGSPAKAKVENGYAVITREWKAGDTVDFVVPMQVQRVKCDTNVAANIGRVALRYGPLIYNIESADQDIAQTLSPSSPLSTEWRPDLLSGVLTIKGKFANDAPMTAIPNYSRLNRGGRSIVWIKEP